MLFGERKRLGKIARAEAAGESFWTRKFDEPVRVKLTHLFTDATDEREVCSMIARGLIISSIGKMHLDDKDWDIRNELLHYLVKCEDEAVLTVIEAVYAA